MLFSCPRAAALTRRCLSHERIRQSCLNFSSLLSQLVASRRDAKSIERHTKVNRKLLVEDRLKLLMDSASERMKFMEFGEMAGLNMKYGTIRRAGLVTGIGEVNGRKCVIVANDATIKGGTIYPITIKKQLRAQQIAEENRLPCIYLVDSGGAYLQLQDEIFPDRTNGGRAFFNQAVMTVPQLAVVLGSCTAG